MKAFGVAALGAVLLALSTTGLVVSCGGNGSGGSPQDGGHDATTKDTGGHDGRRDGRSDGTPGDSGGGDGGDGGGVDTGVCVPGCPAGVTCGDYTDCTGKTITCGSPCAKGSACVETSKVPPKQSCQPISCTGKCGVIGTDACGVAISCGGCPKGDACVKNMCVTAAPVDAGCVPLTCMPDPMTQLCGTVSDGCGHTMDCSCSAGEVCMGGVCAPPPPECAATEAGTRCGSTENACGSGTVDCGGCTGTTACAGGVCTPCTPPTCGAAVCGSVSNGCGPEVSCGTCSGKEENCYDGGCCMHSDCKALLEAGVVPGCQKVDLGCGLKESCLPCGPGYVCDEDGGTCQKCVPKTCSDFSGYGCHSDGCGGQLACCPSGQLCAGSICCPPGQVDYMGTCCQPLCNMALPPGPQVSCGVTIYCAGS